MGASIKLAKTTRKANFEMEKIEAQIRGLRDEVRDMMDTLSKLSLEFSKVLLILSDETDGKDEPFKETKWSQQSFS